MDKLTHQISAGLQRGTRRAWSKLYEAYSERLWREVVRLVGPNAADVADIVHEVFLAAAKSASAGTFDPDRGSLWMWLMGITRRKVALQFRREKSQQENARRWWASLDGTARDWLAGSCDVPDRVLESKELASLVRATLLELPAHYQALLTSRYLDGMAIDLIARQTTSTHEAVRAKLMRARAAFREVFLRQTHDDSKTPGSRAHE